MSDAFELAEFARREERIGEFDIGSAARVMAQLCGSVFAQAQPVGFDSKISEPAQAAIAPIAIPAFRCRGLAEELDFHLLEFARAEDELARRDLIAEAAADLRDAERDLHARGVHHVAEIQKDPLRGLRAKEGC